MLQIRKVAVLGAGTMGARIAAHLANAQVPCVLLDIVPRQLTPQEELKGLTLSDPQVRNRIAQAGLDGALKSRPAAFFVPESAHMVSVGNFEDHLSRLKDCDWIIEAVTEDLEVKRALLRQVELVRAPHALVSSNTSGISIAGIAEGFSDDFRRHWLGTHFFNPPRYMKLLEVIPTPDTLREAVQVLSRFGDMVLGKGVVVAKDTPNFIANRIGTFVTMNVFRIMQQDGYTIEEIDALTGPAMGLPKSATFRTLDIVGLDVLVHVVRNLAQSLPNDERRELFEVPDFVTRMIDRKILGDKTKQGFYKKVKSAGGESEGSEIQTLDLGTLEYRPRQKARLPALEMAQNIEDPRQRIATLIQSSDRAGQFYRKVLGDAFHYAATRIPEISDDIVSVDNAMKWGFNWECGPFELFDAVGVSSMAEKWEKENRPVPPLVEKLLATGKKTFYEMADGITRYFDFAGSNYKTLEPNAGVILLPSLKAAGREVKKNAGASLIDLGDGVICLEFHSKMNSIGADTVQMIHAGLKALNDNFEAMVIGNQSPNFCVGANLMLVLMAIQEGEWDDLHQAVRAFQNANMALKYASKPVVAAPFGLTLGGGVEMCLHTARVRASAETYMGLVEAGVGIIPAGGGTKEMLVRAMDAAPRDEETDPFVNVKEVFSNIGMAKVSTSGEEALKLGYLSARDSISMNRNRQIADAKKLALDLVNLGYRSRQPRDDIQVLGQAAFAKMKLGLHLMRRAEYISDYDMVVATHLAKVLSGGGEFSSPQRVSEQYLLDLEREAFVSLCGQKKTVERMQYMLKKGKPLRN
ncbi:MAG TPA: 3-hydroxyacyl-CoA dehydrogenase NAD-binding domain-containing protein [Terriglobia bacterium]|nr:3-hydroxyacyl-CoA dehydrogenase NAD-binding domain-containing protein [Terriglobia bacterium]